MFSQNFCFSKAHQQVAQMLRIDERKLTINVTSFQTVLQTVTEVLKCLQNS